MLKDAKVTISFSVNDIVEAKKFYGTTLGLDADDKTYPGTLILNLAGGNQAFIYAKADHKPATYTLLNFMVDDIAKTMDELSAQGVEFIHYDLPNLKTDDHDVATFGTMKIAFFNDPSGNNHAVMQMG
jgi:catechol 2,3-dioxygenase-like lactoylglutathione lyase family enzyme